MENRKGPLRLVAPSYDFDVAIIGSSIAGASLAIALGRAQQRVALIDKADFPRRKPCGEGLSHIGLSYLRNLLPPHTFADLPRHDFYGYAVWRKNNAISIPFSSPEQPNGVGAGIQRFYLDNALVQNACIFPSVQPFFGVTVQSVNAVAEGYRVTSIGEDFIAKRVVWADGTNSLLASKHKIASSRKAQNRYGFSMMLEGEYTKKMLYVHVILKDGFEICCTPVSSTRLNLSILGRREALRKTKRAEFVNSLLKEVWLKTGFRGEMVDAALGADLIKKNKRQAVYNGMLCIGDSLECLDPIGGMGMSHALISAHAASKCLLSISRNETNSALALKQYEATCAREVLLLRGFTRITYSLLKGGVGSHFFKIVGDSAFARKVGEAVHGGGEDRSLMHQMTRAMVGMVGAS